MIKNYLATIAFVALMLSPSVKAQAPAGYYNSLNNKAEGELKTAVFNLVHNFTRISSYQALPSYFERTDVYPNSNRWWDMYSDIPFYAPSFSGLNREHSFPKSWWGGSTSVGAYVDLNHLYPSEMKANTAKSNYPLGEVDRNGSLNFDNGISAVGLPLANQGGGARFVFEPDDEYKGDFARTYFYMVCCYQDLTWKYTFMVNNNTYPTLNQWSTDLLMRWHHADPVSQKEVDRNNTVYSIQNNRNPFIDMPELADYLWGAKKGEKFTPGTVDPGPVGDPELIAPVKGMSIDFGEVALGQSVTSQVFVRAANLDGSLDVTIYSGDSDKFKAAQSTIPTSLVCTENGYWLPVTYTPGELGEHTSKILFSGGFGSRAVTLRGSCLPVPVLSACTATDPSDVQPDRYTANWSAPDNEVIDFFVVTRTCYSGNNVHTEELVSENTFLEITDFDQSDREAYSVQSSRLGVRSPMSNIVFVDHSGISGLDVEEPLVVRTFDGLIRFICSAPQTGCRIFDLSGREILTLDKIEQNMEIEMSRGVYIIVTDQHPRPIKVSVL